MNIKLLRSLQVFVQVADTGNMSLAAKSLHMTVSAISQQLRKLEQDIGLSLFNRNTRSLNLTEAGHIYYRSSIKLICEAKKAQLEIEELQQTPSGELSIIAPEGFGGGLLTQPIKHLTSQFPKIKIALQLIDLPGDVISSGADIALCLQPMNDANLVCHHLATWQRVLCVAGDHELASMTEINPAALETHCYIAHKLLEDFQLQESLVQETEQREHKLPPPRVTVNSMQALIQLTRDGVGYGVLPEPEVRHYLKNGELVQIFPQHKLPEYSVYAVTPKHESMPVKTLAAVECMQNWFSSV
ncbi:LysR family transcriptional regulator [Alteromonas pelagimontana]|uniref:LysR family transcriptional regulator n=1 Tax=Alteromonas pelagimontana TaxID=1858656 RepID=A0A6M4MEU6_9ALTE|nr:LysR family transcriptional regulator [Alteromonas pelagimontana]QJR80696.1 LysR family transcriptional regulator [Alteromonas pelagimontana]